MCGVCVVCVMCIVVLLYSDVVAVVFGIVMFVFRVTIQLRKLCVKGICYLYSSVRYLRVICYMICCVICLLLF